MGRDQRRTRPLQRDPALPGAVRERDAGQGCAGRPRLPVVPARGTRGHHVVSRSTQGFRIPQRDEGRRFHRTRRHGNPDREAGDPRRGPGGREPVHEGVPPRRDLLRGTIQQGDRRLDPREQRRRRRDGPRTPAIEARLQPDLHDVRFGRPGFPRPDPAARGNAGPDGQAPEEADRRHRRDHREPDPLQLQRGPQRARVLHLDARRAEGAGRHRPQDGGRRLPDAPARRCGAGCHDHRGGLQYDPRA